MYEEQLRRDKRQREQEMKAHLDDLTVEEIYENRDELIELFLDKYTYSESVEFHDDELRFVRVGEVHVEARVPYDGKEEEIRLKPRKMESVDEYEEPFRITDDYLAYRYNILEHSPIEIREEVEERLEPVLTNTERLSKQLSRTNDYFKRKIDEIVGDEYEVAKRAMERFNELEALDESEYDGRDRDVPSLPAS